MDLTVLSQVAQIVGSVGVVLALVFGVAQIHHFRRERMDKEASELMRPFLDSEFTHAFMRLYTIPDGVSAAELRAMGLEYERAAFAIGIRLEMVGLLVFRGNIPFHLVEELVGGVTVALWTKLAPWAKDIRANQDQPRFMEWFQWLAERMAENRKPSVAPAHEQHKAWRPTR